jgi:hypothetical protein
MSPKEVPTNDLDRALMALAKSKSALPSFMRELGKGELWFVTPFHPEIIGETMEIGGGMRSPFSELQDEEGPYVPLFSSFERLEESLELSKVPANTYAAAAMEAVLVLELLGKMNLRARLNQSCKTGSLMMPPDLMRDVADGSAFEPRETESTLKSEVLNIVDPADYPTDLLQPVFEILRQHRHFRAAWVLEHGKPDDNDAAAGRHFQFLIHMEPKDPTIYHDFNLVLANAALANGHQADSGYVDETDTAYLASLWQQVPPFYTAPDHKPPTAG